MCIVTTVEPANQTRKEAQRPWGVKNRGSGGRNDTSCLGRQEGEEQDCGGGRAVTADLTDQRRRSGEEGGGRRRGVKVGGLGSLMSFPIFLRGFSLCLFRWSKMGGAGAQGRRCWTWRVCVRGRMAAPSWGPPDRGGS